MTKIANVTNRAPLMRAAADFAITALHDPGRRSTQRCGSAVLTPERLELSCPPIADCARYDNLRAPAITVEVRHGAL